MRRVNLLDTFVLRAYTSIMGKHSVLIGEVILDQEPRIALYAETEISVSREGIELLKEKLANLLDTRFRPSESGSSLQRGGLTVLDVAALLHCSSPTVLRMIEQGRLHPISDEDGVLYFDREEVAKIAHIPLSFTSFRIVPRK